MMELWELIVLRPMVNGLVALYSFSSLDFGIAIIIFTILTRVLILPLTLKQLKATKAMSVLQPKLQELQKKYDKDKAKLSQETMKLYKEGGISPMGCLVPTLVQMPIWIALYQAIIKVNPSTPQDLFDLSRLLYPAEWLHSLVPLKEHFLWLNLGQPDTLMILPVLVGGSMWVQQKMVTTTGGDPRQESMNKMMLWMFPMMFFLFSLQFASGLALYWIVSNIIGIVIQYFVTGWGGLRRQSAPVVVIPPAAQKTSKDSALKRKN